ncbi:ornithine cyclodeaminase family protein [Lentibacillus sp.]|jgi:ornithine cyclodeaminase|uniref:ornithine cyclodeaminase family protein n=1 Tax=Lentibacillus sp. TaxID=1925746 RepID=UPI002B4B3F61|nr:ornithine cyclodeaminase family protein [Lentibacillus sp.]HLS08371.1 ornithine cyclodeaminase family protein [Lentibacillus sp.]
MLFLNERDIKEAVTMKDVIDAIDETYLVYESGQFQMPQRMHLKEGDNTLLLMPSITEDAIGTKLVTIFPNNQKLPTLHGLVVLNSSETGEIKGILNGAFLTGMRTGAIGGSGVRHLARKDAASLAIVGTGVQGLYQAIAACTERPIETVHLFNRSPEKMPAFKESLQKWVGSDVVIKSYSSVEEAINDVDIVITTTTSNDPVLPDNPEILKNKLVIGVGSFQPTMREFPQSLFKVADKVMVDTEHAIEESGDIAIPIEKGWIDRDSILTVSELVSNNKQVNVQEGGTIVLKSTGMALFDVVVANLMYQKAQEKGAGTNLSM